MENYIYERDYSDKFELDSETEAKIDKILSSPEFKLELLICEVKNNLPRKVNPAGKAAFDLLVPELDKYAQEMGCRIKAEIDYSHNIATIELTDVEFEFSAKHFDLIKAAAQNSATFGFESTDKNEMRWKIYINYFEDLTDFEHKKTHSHS